MPSCLYATPFPPVNWLAEWIPAAGKQRAGSKDEEGDNFKNDCPQNHTHHKRLPETAFYRR